MKKFCYSLILAISLTLLTQPLWSQHHQHGIAYRLNRVNYITPRNVYGVKLEDNDWKNIILTGDFRAMELAYYCHMKDGHTSFSIPLKMGVGRIPNASFETARREVFSTLDVLAQHQLFKTGKYFLNPFVHYGLGGLYNFNAEYLDWNIPVGAGLNIKLSDNLYLSAQTQFRTGSDRRNGWHHGVGLLLNFGATEETPKISDRDGDGISDLTDACPDEAGLAPLMGCPDKDADGIADKDDKCPDVAGTAALMGCPDKDADGITDADDACPDQKGIPAFNGCPDTDGDGVQDKEDNCPREKGLVALKGCPDKDGDGIADKDDACPNEKGVASAKGCPDKDGDSVKDKDDKCPDKAGDVAHKGCPDSDGDGVYDDEDRCPDKPGAAARKGCPEVKKEDKAKLESVAKNVQFETGKATLLQKSYAVLDEVTALMNQYKEYSLTISGHTDNVGDDAKNQLLSEQRAKACYDYLVSKGIAAERMKHAGYGETKPVADNATKAGRDANRRVDFELDVQ